MVPADISSKVGLEEAEDIEGFILQMLEAGDINARIESPTGTVQFREDVHGFSSASMTTRLETDLQTTVDLTERARKLEARLMTNAAFIQKVGNS